MIRLNADCINCILKRYLSRIPENLTEIERLEYIQMICKKISSASKEEGAPVLIEAIKQEMKEKYQIHEDFTEEKHYFNNMLLEKEIEIETLIRNAIDPFKHALKYSMTGNYIDFGSMNVVDEDYLQKLLDTVEERPISDEIYKEFCLDLNSAKEMVFLTDNCGEIVMDKVFIKMIKERYPEINITVIVRGDETLNDATMKDAEEVFMTDLVNVIHNGNAIAGTCLSKISEEALKNLNKADVIISKGQANFETLRGCGKNIYYIFLCKCDMFANRFGVAKYTGMFLNDKDYMKMMDGIKNDSNN
ncbi:MAG: DUF89 family protein [Lachnospiraceae bacterium]|nr:DUF89 family protein [Lachnospiraceae bacterium]